MPADADMDAEELKLQVRYTTFRVYNARLLDPPATLEKEGFQLFHLDTAANSSVRENELFDIFKSEAETLIKNETGCIDSRILNLVHRDESPTLPPDDPDSSKSSVLGGGIGYVRRVHTDVSPWIEVQEEWRKFAKRRHGAVYNIWRSIDFDSTVERDPLAVCALGNVDPCDMIPACSYQSLTSSSGFVSYNLVYNPFQRWFYYPNMQADEALVFRLYDSRVEDQSRRGVFHATAQDPNALPNAKIRKSVEIRVGALFEDETLQEERRERFLAELPPVPESIRQRP